MSTTSENLTDSVGARRWRFGNAELDERGMELRVNGELSALEPKPLEVLQYLLRHAGEVVTKDELAEACWPRRVLSDSVLTKTISRLREVLGDEPQAVIKTVHGYGYRLVAPVTVLAPSRQPVEPPRLGFKAGDHPPQRPLWSLVERLGSGGSGEAWLARHDKTREQRVYKFPLDVLALGSLKREITLSRLLGEAAAGRVARVLDWNLDEEPYFIECEYAAGGNLAQWAERQGGLLRLAPELRLEIAAQIAETLAAAHGVGVLHKDLKPSNVLVDSGGGGPPRIKLADFGSGGVLDPERLEALGITRLGFTRTLSAADTGGSGTPMYLAPEVLAGQPATVQADLYALGVMLYQLVAGDFRRPLAPGWELEISDELLREDIAAAAAGDPARRLADASALAQRLRSLEARREQRAREKAAAAAAEAARVALERMKLRRSWMLATIAALSVGAVISFGLFLDARRARNEAAASARDSRAVAEFLARDVFANVSGKERPPRDWTVEQLLDAAAQQVDVRLSQQPEAAARVRAALGGAYMALEIVPAAQKNLRQAYIYFSQQSPPSTAAISVAADLVVIDYVTGQLDRNLPDYEQKLAEIDRMNTPSAAEMASLRRRLAWVNELSGAWLKAAENLKSVLKGEYKRTPEYAPDEALLATVLYRLGDFKSSEQHFRRALQLWPATEELSIADTRLKFSSMLTMIGRYQEAQSQLSQASLVLARWAPNETSAIHYALKLAQADLFLQQGSTAEAVEILEPLLQRIVAAQEAGIDQSSRPRELLALAYAKQGKAEQAVTLMREALSASEHSSGIQHPASYRIRVELADLLRGIGKITESQAVLRAASAATLEKLPTDHPIVADRHRLEGLLLAADQRIPEAKAALGGALLINERLFGPDHWRTRRVQRELSQLL